MEVDAIILEGQARLLNVATDSLKEFITKFNAVAAAEDLVADFTDTHMADATSLEVQWSKGEARGVARYHLDTQTLTLLR